MRILISLLCLICTSLTLAACVADANHTATTAPMSAADRATWKKLDQPLAKSFHSDSAEFSVVLDWFTHTADVKVEPDWLIIEQTIPKNTIISIDLHDITAREALELILEEASGAQATPLDYKVRNGAITISTGCIEPRTFEIGDVLEYLAGPNGKAQDAIEDLRMLLRSVVYRGWIIEPGEDPFFHFEGTKLTVRDISAKQDGVEYLLESLRQYKNRMCTAQFQVFISPRPLAELAERVTKEHRKEFYFTQEEINACKDAKYHNFEVISAEAAEDLAGVMRSDKSIVASSTIETSALNAFHTFTVKPKVLGDKGVELRMRIIAFPDKLLTQFGVQIVTDDPASNFESVRSVGGEVSLGKADVFFRERKIGDKSWMIMLVRSRLEPQK